ncbi:MAG: NAD-dependent epimerase/dehydratase family protein [Magnetococcales bacterium]|nr:NAD-dependent epimerase/dehydratase family protein [Magnetococcales bacterium]
MDEIALNREAQPLALVTGAGGFIGRYLCALLQRRGVRVRALLRSERDGPWDESCIGDLGQPLPDGAMTGVHWLFHLAAVVHDISGAGHGEAQYQEINVGGARRLAKAAGSAGVKRVVFFSSIKAVGEGGQGWDEDHPTAPVTAYGRTKRAAERLFLEGDWPFESVVIRPPMVFGNTRKGQLPRMIQAVRKGYFPPLPERENRRSMVHVQDLVEAALLAARHEDAAGCIYMVDDGENYTPRRIFDWIREALGMKPLGWSIPMVALRGMALAGDGAELLLRRRFPFNSEALGKLTEPAWFDSGRIRRELGYVSRRNLRDALPEMIHYLELP